MAGADVTSAAARAHCPRSEAVVIDIRGTSGAAAWMMVMLLVWSARLQLPSADPLAGTSSRERPCARLSAGAFARQLYGKGSLFRDCLARPITTAEVIATERHHRLQKAGSLLVENPSETSQTGLTLARPSNNAGQRFRRSARVIASGNGERRPPAQRQGVAGSESCQSRVLRCLRWERSDPREPSRCPVMPVTADRPPRQPGSKRGLVVRRTPEHPNANGRDQRTAMSEVASCWNMAASTEAPARRRVRTAAPRAPSETVWTSTAPHAATSRSAS